jgi:hypothetical protein
MKTTRVYCHYNVEWEDDEVFAFNSELDLRNETYERYLTDSNRQYVVDCIASEPSDHFLVQRIRWMYDDEYEREYISYLSLRDAIEYIAETVEKELEV